MCNPPFESPEICNLSLFNLMNIIIFASQNQDIIQKSCERTKKFITHKSGRPQPRLQLSLQQFHQILIQALNNTNLKTPFMHVYKPSFHYLTILFYSFYTSIGASLKSHSRIHRRVYLSIYNGVISPLIQCQIMSLALVHLN